MDEEMIPEEEAVGITITKEEIEIVEIGTEETEILGRERQGSVITETEIEWNLMMCFPWRSWREGSLDGMSPLKGSNR